VRALIAAFASEVDVFAAEANGSEASGSINEMAARRGLDQQICQEAFLSLIFPQPDGGGAAGGKHLDRV
jgi:hypothetical protein